MATTGCKEQCGIVLWTPVLGLDACAMSKRIPHEVEPAGLGGHEQRLVSHPLLMVFGAWCWSVVTSVTSGDEQDNTTHHEYAARYQFKT
jgi:hypothetical protein